MTQLALNLDESRRRKHEGMEATASANSEWIASALAELKVFATYHAEFCIEHFRGWRSVRNQPEPTTHHAWGALTRAAIQAKVIRWTGRYTQASSVKTHSHPIKVWRRG